MPKNDKKDKVVIHNNINTYEQVKPWDPGGTSVESQTTPGLEADIDKIMRYKPMWSIEWEEWWVFVLIQVWDPVAIIDFGIGLAWIGEFTSSNPFLIWYNRNTPGAPGTDGYIIKKWWVYQRDVWLSLQDLDDITKIVIRVALYQWTTVLQVLDKREIEGKASNLNSDISLMSSCWPDAPCIAGVLQPIITDLANRQRLDYVFKTIPVRFSRKAYIKKDPLYKDPWTPDPYKVCVDIQVFWGSWWSLVLWQGPGNHFQIEWVKQAW